MLPWKRALNANHNGGVVIVQNGALLHRLETGHHVRRGALGLGRTAQKRSEMACVSPFLQRLSSDSSFWMLSFRVLFFSFSFSYFLFHCSAVSSRLMEAVFLMVLAL
uniref:Transmembrane protein n=1 Tax=Mola mola TaxID=94237 RepID=A0A3Q3WY03_MOLML